MAIFEIVDRDIRPIERTTFEKAGLRERQDLQGMLRERIDVALPGVLVIAEEFGDWEDSRRRLDLLGVEKDGSLVVIELKRTEDGGHMELQALRYAAMVSAMTFDQAVEAYRGVSRPSRAEQGRAGSAGSAPELSGVGGTRRGALRVERPDRADLGRLFAGADNSCAVAEPA